MKRWGVLFGAVAVLSVCALTAVSQPPDGGPDKKGPPDREKGGQGRGQFGGPRMPMFQLGQVMPPRMREELQLTDEQKDKLDALEKEVKEKLSKILTPEQIKQLENMTPPQGGPDSKDGKGRRPDGRDGKDGKEGKGKRFEEKDGKTPPRPERPPE